MPSTCRTGRIRGKRPQSLSIVVEVSSSTSAWIPTTFSKWVVETWRQTPIRSSTPRGGSIFVNFGLDTDNVLKVGGGNMEANAYPVIHAGNYNNYINQALVQVGLGGVGSYGIFAVLDNAAPTATVRPGVVVDGSILIYSSCYANYHSGQRPAGTWRCMGYVVNRDANTPDSATLFQRVT
ncbi:catalytic tail fiber protein with peptidase S74 domain [Pseudomonas phage FIM]|nr:catalytic tail fiber protein with peptidase S74 domain [Pseudomonas phage FIM]